MSDEAALIRQVSDALSAGVAGIAFGRNIWSSAEPATVTARLVEVIHSSSATSSRPAPVLAGVS